MLKEDADQIIGKAGKNSPCAAQGLASVGAVDDKAYTAEAEIDGQSAVAAMPGA